MGANEMGANENGEPGRLPSDELRNRGPDSRPSNRDDLYLQGPDFTLLPSQQNVPRFEPLLSSIFSKWSNQYEKDRCGGIHVGGWGYRSA